jgi:hypothetical protein
LTHDSYKPTGLTALYDAVSAGVCITNCIKAKDERVICLILTDGQENASKKTSKSDLKEIITSKESQGDWTFVYIGEDPEGWKNDSGTVSDNTLCYGSPWITCRAASYATSKLRHSQMKQSNDVFDKFYSDSD